MAQIWKQETLCVPRSQCRGAGVSFTVVSRVQVSQTVVAMLASSNNSKSLDVVLRLGARVDPLDDSGTTPLFRASAAGFAEVCRVLVAHGANVIFRHKV
jgi:ankyrin repeat protein